MLRFIVTASNRFPSFRYARVVKTWQGFTSAACSTKCPAEAKGGEEELLQSKLSLLTGLGVDAHDLVKIINCRPKFLGSRINHHFDEKIAYFLSFFGSKKTLLNAIVRNPSLLLYDFHYVIKPSIAIYEEMGFKKMDLITMILYRATIISRTSFNDEKLEYIHRTGVSKDSNMYKYVH
ncbi:hypothetical protein L6164_018130 [Bauhinia variegata]|uniref:Uncharacterized protein n=1 Tax=Bauhinia variegata TaxID=167791 RepID=A0ACB9NAU1_BAUVA|nr:hypothetical protein L6164_018130 [Bauhinia variegata]